MATYKVWLCVERHNEDSIYGASTPRVRRPRPAYRREGEFTRRKSGGLCGGASRPGRCCSQTGRRCDDAKT